MPRPLNDGIDPKKRSLYLHRIRRGWSEQDARELGAWEPPASELVKLPKFIGEYKRKHGGTPPGRVEISKHLNVTASRVSKLVARLVKSGEIVRHMDDDALASSMEREVGIPGEFWFSPDEAKIVLTFLGSVAEGDDGELARAILSRLPDTSGISRPLKHGGPAADAAMKKMVYDYYLEFKKTHGGAAPTLRLMEADLEKKYRLGKKHSFTLPHMNYMVRRGIMYKDGNKYGLCGEQYFTPEDMEDLRKVVNGRLGKDDAAEKVMSIIAPKAIDIDQNL
jgi:hypothetical protein